MGTVNFAKMAPSYAAAEFRKSYENGDYAEMGRDDWHQAPPSEYREQSYMKFITMNPLGRELFRTFQNSEVRALYRTVFEKAAPPDPSQDFAEATMRSLAARHHAANPGKTFEQSYVEAFTAPENRSLADRVKAESIGRAQAVR